MQEARTARLALGLSAASLLLGGFNAWQLANLGDGVRERGGRASVEGGTARSAAGSGEDEAAAGAQREGGWLGALSGASTSSPSPGAPLDLEDPSVQAGIAAVVEQEEARRDEERSERFRASVLDELAAFAEEEQLDDATRQQVEAEFLRRMEAFRVMREDVRSGAISWIEARKQMEAAREASEATLAGLLGQERAEALDERIFGGMRGGPPPR